MLRRTVFAIAIGGGLAFMAVAALVFAFGAYLTIVSTANAEDRYPTVDVALVLAVDVSASVDDREREIQRQGYADAIQSPAVLKAIAEGAHGRILVTVFEWSDYSNQDVRVPWMVIAGPEDAKRAAALITAPGSRIPHSTTSISGALVRSAALIKEAPEKAERVVVDVSGDGRDYEALALRAAREALKSAGVVINGLPILSSPDDPDVADYYETNVIAGPGSFVSPAKGFHDLAPALVRKLVLELT